MDVFNEYEDAEIVRPSSSHFDFDLKVSQTVPQYEALRRVHLIPAEDAPENDDTVNANVFRDLDSPVSEGGENFSTGYVDWVGCSTLSDHLLQGETAAVHGSRDIEAH